MYSCSCIVVGHGGAYADPWRTDNRPFRSTGERRTIEAVWDGAWWSNANGKRNSGRRHHSGENFPSKSYEHYFKDHGVDPVWAQPLGSLTISLGTREANASRQLAEVVEALRFLAQGNRRKRAILFRARRLLAAHDETSMLDQIFGKAGLNDTELSELGNQWACARFGDGRKTVPIAGWPTSNRNPGCGRLPIGMRGRLRRNPHRSTAAAPSVRSDACSAATHALPPAMRSASSTSKTCRLA